MAQKKQAASTDFLENVLVGQDASTDFLESMLDEQGASDFLESALGVSAAPSFNSAGRDISLDFLERIFGTPDIISDKGYKIKIVKEGIAGLALLSGKQLGKNLVMRLKDADGDLPGEVEFWAKQLALLFSGYGGFACVTNPPASAKHRRHLATDLATVVAGELGLPHHNHFINCGDGGKRAPVSQKLKEEKAYDFSDLGCGNILVVDDVICTRMTARACVRAAGAAINLFFLFLYIS
jgi:hypothetical protein